MCLGKFNCTTGIKQMVYCRRLSNNSHSNQQNWGITRATLNFSSRFFLKLGLGSAFGLRWNKDISWTSFLSSAGDCGIGFILALEHFPSLLAIFRVGYCRFYCTQIIKGRPYGIKKKHLIETVDGHQLYAWIYFTTSNKYSKSNFILLYRSISG